MAKNEGEPPIMANGRGVNSLPASYVGMGYGNLDGFYPEVGPETPLKTQLWMFFGAGFGYRLYLDKLTAGQIQFIRKIDSEQEDNYPRYHIMVGLKGDHIDDLNLHWDVDSHVTGPGIPQDELARLLRRSWEDQLFDKTRTGQQIRNYLFFGNMGGKLSYHRDQFDVESGQFSFISKDRGRGEPKFRLQITVRGKSISSDDVVLTCIGGSQKDISRLISRETWHLAMLIGDNPNDPFFNAGLGVQIKEILQIRAGIYPNRNVGRLISAIERHLGNNQGEAVGDNTVSTEV